LNRLNTFKESKLERASLQGHYRITNHVVDSSSIEINRRRRRAKSDGLDVRKLLSMLMRYEQGERHVWQVVKVPSVERAGRCWGLCRYRHLIHLKVHVRIPALEDDTQLPIQRPYSRL